MERLNTDLVVVGKHVFGQAAVKSELLDTWNASSRFETCWKSALEHVKPTESHLAQVAQQLTVLQANLEQEKSH